MGKKYNAGRGKKARGKLKCEFSNEAGYYCREPVDFFMEAENYLTNIKSNAYFCNDHSKFIKQFYNNNACKIKMIRIKKYNICG